MEKLEATIKVLTEGIPGYYVGQEVRVEVDHEGTPLDVFWRRRLRDSAIDGCCELVRRDDRSKESKTRAKSTQSGTRKSLENEN